jgi:hypothetical protein
MPLEYEQNTMSIKLIAVRLPAARPFPVLVRVQWLGYCALVAVMVTYYLTVLLHGAGTGVDFACFRAATIMFAHGGNPYDLAQLWRVENALYNAPLHLHPGSAAYYDLDRYYNPPLFATALTPFARLPLTVGYAIYAAITLGLAIVGAWLTLLALGWTRRRGIAIAIVIVSPCVFLIVWSGQQSSLLFFALGAALYMLRRERFELAGAVMALGWVKPHLLIPVALVAPLLLFSPRVARRWYAGFGAATVCGLLLTVLTTGASSILAWLHALFGYTGYVDSIQTYLPSLAGMILVMAPHPLNKALAVAVMILGVSATIVVLARARRSLDPIAAIIVLMAAWLMFTPFAHANDDVLLLPALAVAWGRNGEDGARLLPRLALWALSALPLAFLLSRPWDVLGVLPVGLAFLCCYRSTHLSHAAESCASARTAW